MATPKTVWGIDIGACALKALKLRSLEGELRLEAFDVIEHPRILTQPDVDAELLTRNALEQFLARNNVADSTVVVSAPGKSGITRFVKLPPVEAKQVPEIVRFEAEQQIPFDINEVIWRWQPFRDPDSPDIEVGIFAMKRPDVSAVLDRFAEVYMSVDVVQMAPLALYNFLVFDGQDDQEGATLLVDIGADKTDLVVSDGPRIWTRTMQRGGNNFTEALVKAFKLNFNKAEKLKRTAATSKYARQIFQAMRPVFAELVQEIQRSIGYYSSQHRDSRFKRVVGLGNGFRLPGLQKYLEQNLGLAVVRVDSFNKLSPSATVNAPAFTENILSFAVAYGLALQGLGLTKIHTNLLPAEIARHRLWDRKRPWFVGAAAALLLACGGIAYSAYRDRNMLQPEKSEALPKARQFYQKYDGLRSEFNRAEGQAKEAEAQADPYLDMTRNNDFWEKLHSIVSQTIERTARHQRLMNLAGLDQLKAIERSQRSVIVLTDLWTQHVPDVTGMDEKDLRSYYGGSGPVSGGGARGAIPFNLPGAGEAIPRSYGFQVPAGPDDRIRGTPIAPPTGAPGQQPPAAQSAAKPGFLLYLKGSTPKQGMDATLFLKDLKNALIEVAKEFPSLHVELGDQVYFGAGKDPSATGSSPEGRPIQPGGRETGPTVLDPLTGEDASGDTTFAVGWIFQVEDAQSDQAAPAGGVAQGGAR